mmetsp:Transcript_120437/g.384504  ORF Transcript_120437/g.384504 Transcript_120437/m.384504 type:complete len:469 (-) Transcript_120437:2446-3852(-)
MLSKSKRLLPVAARSEGPGLTLSKKGSASARLLPSRSPPGSAAACCCSSPAPCVHAGAASGAGSGVEPSSSGIAPSVPSRECDLLGCRRLPAAALPADAGLSEALILAGEGVVSDDPATSGSEARTEAKAELSLEGLTANHSSGLSMAAHDMEKLEARVRVVLFGDVFGDSFVSWMSSAAPRARPLVSSCRKMASISSALSSAVSAVTPTPPAGPGASKAPPPPVEPAAAAAAEEVAEEGAAVWPEGSGTSSAAAASLSRSASSPAASPTAVSRTEIGTVAAAGAWDVDRRLPAISKNAPTNEVPSGVDCRRRRSESLSPRGLSLTCMPVAGKLDGSVRGEFVPLPPPPPLSPPPRGEAMEAEPGFACPPTDSSSFAVLANKWPDADAERSNGDLGDDTPFEGCRRGDRNCVGCGCCACGGGGDSAPSASPEMESMRGGGRRASAVGGAKPAASTTSQPPACTTNLAY